MTDDRIAPAIPRDLLEKYFKDDPRLVSHFEEQSIAVQEVVDVSSGTVSATESLQNATVVTLSPNAVFNNEFVLTRGDGTKLRFVAGVIQIDADDTVVRCEGGGVKLLAPANVTLLLPVEGTLVSDTSPAKLYSKTLDKPGMTGLIDAVSNAAAAAAGVAIGGIYRDGTTLKIRIA